MGRFPKLSNKCEICGKELTELYCTTSVCQECCMKGLCPYKSWCRAYPTVLEKILRRRKYNPARRDSGGRKNE